MKAIFKAAAILALSASVLNAAAADNDDNPRRWAVSVGFGTSCFGLNDDGSGHWQKAKFGEPSFTVGLEYYIPRSKFSITAGYDHEEIERNEGGGAYSGFAEMNNLSLGGRFYPLSKGCFFQPYASIATYWNMEGGDGSWTETVGDGKRTSRCKYSSPLFSVAPKVGFDVYLLSCLALEFEYGYRIAAGGKAEIASQYDGRSEIYTSQTRLNRHNIAFGLKATFPFRLTNSDARSVFDALFPPFPENRNSSGKSARKSQRLRDVINNY